MSKYSRKKRQKKIELQQQAGQGQPWISLKSGRRLIWAVSIALALLVAWQVTPQKGLAQGLLWGLIFGGMIWLVFEGYSRLNRALRRLR